MKKLIALLGIVSVMFACNQAKNSKSDTDQAQNIEKVSVAQVLHSPANYVDHEVKITGMVTHVCKHGGQKLFIIDTDPESQLRINVGNNIPEFDVALEGSTVEFTGYVRKLTEAQTEQLEKDVEEKEHHTGDEPHATAENSSYYIEAIAFKEQATE